MVLDRSGPRFLLCFVVLALLLLGAGRARAEAAAGATTAAAPMFDLSTTWYLHAGIGEEGGDQQSAFHVSRGYLTFRFRPTAWFQARATLDTHLDDDGFEVRLKYLYGRFVLPIETVAVTEPYLEFGLVHMPWLDFEEHINRYRMQGTMFTERSHLFNSADVGLTAGVLLGDKLDAAYARSVGDHYPGRWGSVAVGFYNGGGYHDAEANDDKVVEVRVSLRPLHFVLPGLQLSYFFVHGAGNTAEEPLWQNHAAMVSYVHRYFALTGTYTYGTGNQKGTELDAAGDSLGFQGFSVFAEGRMPCIDTSLFVRYDWFDWDRDGGEEPQSRVIAGVAYWFLGKSALVLDADILLPPDGGVPNDWQVKLTLQFKYP